MKKQGGMRFSADPMAVVLFVCILFTERGEIAPAVLIAAAVHECGHLLAAKLLGIPLCNIRLELLGARITPARLLSYREECLLSLAGPLFSVLLAAGTFPLGSSVRFCSTLAAVSLLLGILNLLPVRGFDGGRALSAVLCVLTGDRAAAVVSAILSFLLLFFVWCGSVYLLLRVGSGISWFCFSMGVFLRFFGLFDS